MANLSHYTTTARSASITNKSFLNASFGKLLLPKSDSTPLSYTLSYAVLAVLVIASNGFVISIFLKNRELRKRKSHLFLLSLSCADFLVGLCSLAYVFSIRSKDISRHTKRISTIVQTFSLETSMFSLCCLTYERLVAIRDSLQYQNLITSKTVIAAIIATWVVSALLTCTQGTLAFMIDGGNYFAYNSVIVVAFALITSVFLAAVYLYLYKEIRRHTMDIRSKSASVANSIDIDMLPTIKSADDVLESRNFDNDVEHDSAFRRKKSKTLLKLSKEKRSFIFCLLIVSSFIICWMPITVFCAGSLFGINDINDVMAYVSTVLVLVNSLLNPIIYFGLRKDMRRAAITVLCK